jgi:hypothetical protein
VRRLRGAAVAAVTVGAVALLYLFVLSRGGILP